MNKPIDTVGGIPRQTPLEHEFHLRFEEVRNLDPELVDFSDQTRELVKLGLETINQVTEKFGTPEKPKWASGTFEKSVFMGYHNGGENGHSSVGPNGVGVPRNVLVIAKAVNEAAGVEIYDPLTRAIDFNAAAAHDMYQLCGRSLLQEGQVDQTRGDERLSAEYARDTYLQRGGDIDIAKRIYDGVMATAFNPNTGSQNILGRDAYATDADYIRGSLDQELVASADLLSPSTIFGPLRAFEYCVETLCQQQKDQIIQSQLRASDIAFSSVDTMRKMLEFIESNPTARAAFGDALSGQGKFFKDFLAYSDSSIRMVCGKSIDELFTGRLENAETMEGFSAALKNGESAVTIWEMARELTIKKAAPDQTIEGES